MTHMYFSAEGRISYGHLGRTNSCIIGITGNLHDVDLKAFSDIPDTVVNSSAVVGLDKFIPSFAVSDVSLF